MEVFLKIISPLIFSLICISSANAISPGENYETTIALSPSRRQHIANDWCCYKDGGYVGEGTGIERSTLYSLPLDTASGIPLLPGDYRWSEHGMYFITEEWVRDTGYNFSPVYQHRIWGYNTSGEKIDVPGYGASPAFSILGEASIIYSSEFSDSGELIAPRLFEFNFQERKRKLLATFPDTFTFWGPDLNEEGADNSPIPITGMWGGYRGIIYKKNPEPNEDGKCTFIAPWSKDPKSSVWKGLKLIIWKGDYTSSLQLPKDAPLLEEK